MTRRLLQLVDARTEPVGVVLSLLVVLGVLVLSRREATLSPRARRGAGVIVWLAVLGMGGLAAIDALANVKWFRPWDFPSFYVVARAAAHGLSFYDPAVMSAVQQELTRAPGVPDEWLRHEAGYWYLPPSVFLLWPLGLLDYRAALAVHYLVQGAFLAGSVWLLHRSWPIGRGALGAGMMMLLALLFRPVQSTIFFAQIVFGCLFFLLLAERRLERSGVSSGVSLGVAFFYKHLALIPAAVMLASRDRRLRVAGLFTLVTIGAALLLSAAVFGPGVFGAYLANGPGARPPELAIDPVVQSLLALIYRVLGATPHGSLLQIMAFPPYLVGAGSLAIATLVLLWRRRGSARRERFWLVASLAVLCYPNTLFSTLALVFPVLFVFLGGAERRGWPSWAAGALILLVYALAGFLPVHAGWIAAACWGAMAVLLAGEPSPEAVRA